MKNKNFTFLLILIAFTFSVKAQENSNKSRFELTDANKHALKQTGYVRCLTNESETLLDAKYPNRLNNEAFENWLSPKLKQIKIDRAQGRLTSEVINIPVVIHIIHDGDALGSGENITDAQALSQIKVMNEDFRRLAGTKGGANSTGLAVDTGINFCIAARTPNGEATNGVVRHNISPYTNEVNNPTAGQPDWETMADVQRVKRDTQWDPEKYLNMWTFRFGGKRTNEGGLSGVLGFAQFPVNSGIDGLGVDEVGQPGEANTDGVTASYNAMGTKDEDDGTFILNQNYNLGRTMTHEVGHWIGLRHIWGDGDCSKDDYCDDTPTAKQANYSCNEVDSCTNNFGVDMIQNYMDYTNDACMDTFTQDQKDRMIAVMNNSPRRKELKNSNGCQSPDLSVNSFNLENVLSIYPNPTENVLTIKSENAILPNKYSIYNTLGQLVTSKKINAISDLTINTSVLSKGMYFIKIAKENNTVTFKFLKK